MSIGRRHRTPVTITTVPRSTLEHTYHREIDGILKDLKLCSRRLKLAQEGFKDELRTLERLYYKSKNQHRMALFFKRVPEMRRYGRRLSEMDILERVDLLRASFVGLGHTNDHKALRCSWSHIPEKPYVYFLAERLTACSTLVCNMRERLEKAYHHFTLAMQTGAFVQLIILFVAISSRMSVLSSEIEEALQLSVSTCNRLLGIIHPTGAHATFPQQVLSGSETTHPSHIDRDRDLPSEDAGQPVSRCEPTDNSVPVVEDIGMKMEGVLEIRTPTPPRQPTDAVDHTTVQASKKITTKAAKKPRLKRAKKKLDEIDEIFASL